ALAVGTTVILREGKKPEYALLTLAPLLFVGTTTISAGVESIRTLYLPMMDKPATQTVGTVNAVVTALLLSGVISVLVGSALKWVSLFRERRTVAEARAT